MTGIGYAKHYGQDKLVVQLDNSVSYLAGEFLEACKDRLLSSCKIIIEKFDWIKQEEKVQYVKLYKKVTCLVW